MSSNDALELAINAATKALESAQRLHSLESYPESLTRGLGTDNDETSIPTVDILSAKSHLLSTYMLELLNMKQLEEQKEEADEEEKERNTGELNKLKFAILKMRPIEKKMEYR